MNKHDDGQVNLVDKLARRRRRVKDCYGQAVRGSLDLYLLDTFPESINASTRVFWICPYHRQLYGQQWITGNCLLTDFFILRMARIILY